MKKLLVAAAVIISSSWLNTVNAQEGFSVSVKATPQMSWLQNEADRDLNERDIKPLFGASFGLGAGYNFTPHLGIELDVLYSMQGSQYEVNGADFKQRLDYIKTPLMFTYISNPSAPVSFVGKIGPQLSFLTSSELKNDDELINDSKDGYEEVTFGAVANLGVQFRLGSNTYLTTGIRFEHDFTNAEEADYSLYPAGREETYNMSAGLEVGLKYML